MLRLTYGHKAGFACTRTARRTKLLVVRLQRLRIRRSKTVRERNQVGRRVLVGAVTVAKSSYD